MTVPQPLPDSTPNSPQQPPSFAERLRARHGDGLDPTLSLDSEPERSDSSGSSSALVQRLSEHSLKQSRYKLEGEVARGGMGAILRVWDEDLRRHLAMKVILGRGEGTSKQAGGTPQVDPRQLSRFLEEAQVTGQLDHPGIVPVHELGLESDGRVYFTMKLVKGRDLKTVFDRVFTGDATWTETRVLGDLLKVCEAMAFAHAKKVIHRDLKPGNVMVGNFGEVYVMDWGLARVLDRPDAHDIRLAPQFTSGVSSVKTERREEREDLSDSPLVTMDGDIVGTPAYMPPEQARGELEKLSPRSDVYAIGAMIYHLLARQAPYMPRGSRISNRTVLVSVLHGPPQPLTSLRPDAPAELVAIVEKAMAREPEKRYADTLELAADLRAYLEQRVVRAYETGAWAETRKWVLRNKPLAASIAGAMVVISALLLQQTRVAGRLELSNAALETSNAALEVSNVELANQTRRAEAGERRAKDNAVEAQHNATAAQLARDEATQKTADVLSLSAQKDLDDLVAEASNLWPAHPETIPAYEDWLRRSNDLIDGRPADEARGIRKRPSLAEHKAKLAELRRDAKPLSETEIQAERQSHPRYAELQTMRAELLWRSRMLGSEPWPSELEVEAELTGEALPADVEVLSSLALALVDPATPSSGQEMRGMLLARRAVAAATEEKRSGVRDILAWALFRLGRFDEALSEERTALAEPGGNRLQSSAANLETAVAAWRGDQLVKRREARDALAAQVARLANVVNEQRRLEFADPEKAWWNRQLEKLVSDLEALRDPRSGLMNDVRAQPFGWGVARRYAFAKTIGLRSVDGAEAKRLWSEAIGAIMASPKYGGLVLTPQMGLLPIGMDPDSQLWEFAHLQTGESAVRDVDGKLVLTEETGLVFVLIPGGMFWMGAQKTDPNGRNFDPQARQGEGPVHEVQLSPYFLSKYEMTQGQWLRIAAENPSAYRPPEHVSSLLHPVEQVDWWMCKKMTERLGLSLPSEAQWERGARGGTSTAWWTGESKETLVGKVNIADRSFVSAGGASENSAELPELDDGSAFHCAVGKYAANGFGLHEVTGNVWEWCLDGYDGYFYSKGAIRDPVSPWTGSAGRVSRGGGSLSSASGARSAIRDDPTPLIRISGIGFRPSRSITP